MTDRATEIAALLAPSVSALNLELLGVEFVPAGASALLRLYIDVPLAEAATRMVGIDDCETVSREVSATLDVADPIASRYTLEVSSPGIDRPLFTAAQFARHVGEQVKVSLHVPVAGRRRLQGSIVGVDGERIVLRVDDEEISLSHADIDKARIVPDWAALGMPGSGGNGGASGNKNKGRGAAPGRRTQHDGAHDRRATEHKE